MKLEENKVITMGNGEKYLVMSHVEKNNKDYYYIAELDSNGKDIKDNYKIMESIVEEDKVFLNEVVGESNLKVILPLFVNNIKK